MTGDRLAVFDTNVLVSGFLSPNGSPGRIVEWLRTGVVRAGLDDRIVAEYAEVLLRHELGLPPAEVEVMLRTIRKRGVWADRPSPEQPLAPLPDPDDEPFAECALTLECPLVTGNKRHFPKAVLPRLTILSPADFMASLIRSPGV